MRKRRRRRERRREREWHYDCILIVILFMMEFMRLVAAPVSRPDCLFVFVALGFIDAV